MSLPTTDAEVQNFLLTVDMPGFELRQGILSEQGGTERTAKAGRNIGQHLVADLETPEKYPFMPYQGPIGQDIGAWRQEIGTLNHASYDKRQKGVRRYMDFCGPSIENEALLQNAIEFGDDLIHAAVLVERDVFCLPGARLYGRRWGEMSEINTAISPLIPCDRGDTLRW